jgi:hypothetical protein
VLAVVLVLASVTDKLATFATNVVGDLGLPGVFLLMVAESACIPIPSEATMLFAGFNVHQGEYPLWAAVAVGSVANLVGLVDRLRGRLLRSSRAAREAREVPAHHALAPRVGRPLVRALRRAGRLLQPDAADHPHLHLTAGRRGADAVLEVQRADARRLPALGLRADLRRPEGGENWTSWKDSLHYVDYTVAVLIVLGAVYLAVRWRRNRNRGRAADAPA